MIDVQYRVVGVIELAGGTQILGQNLPQYHFSTQNPK
jgi:hypothetical protein